MLMRAAGNITAACKLLSADSLHHLSPSLCRSVFLPGPLVRLMDDRVGSKRQKLHFAAAFLILISLSGLTGVRRSHADMTGLKHTELSCNVVLELYCQKDKWSWRLCIGWSIRYVVGMFALIMHYCTYKQVTLWNEAANDDYVRNREDLFFISTPQNASIITLFNTGSGTGSENI